MDLKERLQTDMKSAMKAGDKERLSVIRMTLSEIKNQEIKAGGALGEEQLISLLSRNAKQRKESIAQFRQGGREDLVDKEAGELRILQEYLPSQISREELREMIEKAIAATGAASLKEIGLVMKQVMAAAGGRADGKEVQQMVREILS